VFASIKEVLPPALYDHFYPDWRVVQKEAVEAVCTSNDYESSVALDGDTVAGFVAIKLDAESKMGEIYMIAVDPDFQRRGIAAALTQHALDRMKQAGMTDVMVETGADPGHAPARATYEKMGFAPWPSVRYIKMIHT
jgi:ribosomal protein S18 acetylase RimI-like enzyme